MILADFDFNGTRIRTNLTAPVADLSMAVGNVARAWYIQSPTFEPVVLGDWKGSVELGGSVNFFNIGFNPHAHGTHTETVGHITRERYSVHEYFNQPFSLAVVLSPKVEDNRVSLASFTTAWQAALEHGWIQGAKSIVVRTDCSSDAILRTYSNTDWPFLEAEIGAFLRDHGIDHLLIDQPSVDQEEDGGALACHRSFWGNTPEESLHRTITELIHVPSSLADGPYLLNLQVAPIENDAAPSRPLLYELL